MRSMLGASKATLTPLHADGVIEPEGAGYRLRLSIEDGRAGEREVFAQRCDELSGVAAVALVLLLTTGGHLADADGAPPDPTDSGGAPPPNPQAPAAPPSEPEPAPDPPRPGRTGRLRFVVDAPLFGLGIGPLPKPQPGLGLGLGLAGSFFSLRMLGQWGLAQQIPAGDPGYGAELSRASAGLWLCGEVVDEPVGVSPCLQGSLTYLSGEGYGPELRPASRNEIAAAVGAGLLVRWKLQDRLGVLLGGGAQVELSRPVLSLEPLGPFQQLSPFSAALILGPEWIF